MYYISSIYLSKNIEVACSELTKDFPTAENYFYYIENPKTKASQLVHEINILGTTDGVSLENPALPMAYRVTSCVDPDGLWSGGADITSAGRGRDRQQYASAISPPKVVTTNTPVMAIRQPDTINGQINTRDIMLARLTALTDKKSDVDF